MRLALAGTLVASATVVPLVVNVQPALAHTQAINADTAAGADVSPDPTINGIAMKVRVLYPTATPESGGWPIMIYMAGQNKNRCANINEDASQASIPSWLTRANLAALGYVVVSFNPRGMPSSNNAGDNPFVTGDQGCDAKADAEDGLNDTGWDYTGATDQADVSALIDWAKSFTCGTQSTCVNSGKIGVIGEGYHGLLTWLMTQDSDVDAVVPIGSPHVIRNLKSISNDGAGTPVFRPVDQGWMTAEYGDTHAGQWGHSDVSVLRNRAAFSRTTHLNPGYPAQNTNGSINITTDKFLLTTTGSPTFSKADIGVGISVSGAGASGGTLTTYIDAYVGANSVKLATPALTTVSSGATVKWSLDAWDAKSFFDTRAVVDDTASVDRTDTITTPVFAVHGFLNGSTSTLPDVEAFTHLAAQGGTSDDSKYLYLGACGAFPAPCQSTNATNLQTLVHKFLDKYVRVDGTSQVTDASTGTNCDADGPCVFRAVPPKMDGSSNPFTTDSWTVNESTSWPPATASSETYCLGWDSPATRGTWGSWTGSGCTASSTSRDNKGIKNKSHWIIDPLCHWYTVDSTPATAGYKQKAWASDERFEYDSTSGTITATEKKLLKVEASLKMKSNTSRMSVYVDLQDVNTSTGIVTTIWQSNAVHVPVARTNTPNSVVTFVFQPGGAAWTVAAGHTLRLAVASKQAFHLAHLDDGPPAIDAYVSSHAQEELVSDYTILHESANPSKVKLWWE